MADHGTVEYATATGNDYPAHEASYERFVFFTLVGILSVIDILFGLTVGGVMDHWLLAVAIFIIMLGGAVPSLFSGSKNAATTAFVLCLLIFAYAGIAP
jgi:Bacterial aa3 type cytochrome c oxidase subunit IV